MQAPEFDLIIRNGSVIDGSGAPAFAADVAVKDGRISKVGPLEPEACWRMPKSRVRGWRKYRRAGPRMW